MQAVSNSASLADRTRRRVNRRLMPFIFLLYIVSYLDRVNISIASGPIADAYHLTDVQLGKVFSSLVAGYAFAWVGHFFFEKNKPATFTYPLYSFMGDWMMWKDVLAGRIAF